MNTPTVFNADLNPRQFWDGRAASLEAQIDGPVHNPLEMASSWPQVLATLGGDAVYTRAFAGAYPDGLTVGNVKDAIATYERTLRTPDSRFDRYLAGFTQAITDEELTGYALFKGYGCLSCHQGSNVGGDRFEHLGLFGNYFADRARPRTRADLGRFNVTRLPEDMYKFRVPALRQVALTAPYFHDGSVDSLPRAVALMGQYQLGQALPASDVAKIAAFLASLAAHPQGEAAPQAAR